MISLLILLPILLSVLATQYETCHIIKHNCTSSFSPQNYVKPIDLNKPMDEVVCNDINRAATKIVYMDLNTGKCYGPVATLGNSPPPSNANLVCIGGDSCNRKNTIPDFIKFIVSSTEGWQDTGLLIEKGDTIEITASGIIRADYSGVLATPDGIPVGEKRTVGEGWTCTYLICGEDIKAKTLVGRIGNPDLNDYSSGFFVGSVFEMISPKSGELFLGFNDGLVAPDRSSLYQDAIADNSGSFTAVIRVFK